jgi:hypothetical protein
MNHKYLLLLLACTAGAAQAQRVNKPHMPAWARPAYAAPAHHQARPADSGARDQGDIVWSEDFANGLAGNNGVGPWTVDGADSQWWVYTHTGPNGAYSVPAEKIVSDSDDNGWMIFQSDSGNTDWNADPPTIVATPTPWDAGLVSPALDLTATPYVRVEFQQALRYCCSESPHFLQVMTGTGNDWTGAASYPVVTTAVNDDPGTLTTSVNISNAIAGGDLTNVRFRFYHNSASNSSHYHWQIDDVKVIELNNLDVALVSAGTSDWDANTAFTYDSLNYTVYPYGQLRPIPLNALVENNGSQAQTGLVVNFSVNGGSVLDQDQTIDLGGGLTERVYVNPDFTPPAVEGTYDVSVSVTSSVGDTTDDNNTGEDQFKVDPYVYSRDGGTVADYEQSTADGEYELCNGFHVANETELYSIDVALRSGGTPSPVGIPITGVLKDGSDVEIEIIQTMEHTIASNELNGTNGTKVIHLIFAEPQLLEAGLDYFVCIKHFGGAEVRTGINGSAEDQSSFIYYEQDPDVGPEWFFTNDMPMVRMNFNSTVGIEEGDFQNGIGMGQNVPNPANGMTMIPYDLQEAATLTFEVHDLSGKLVATQAIGKRSTGSHRLQFDTTSLGEGVYVYSLVVDGTRLTKRMTVIR